MTPDPAPPFEVTEIVGGRLYRLPPRQLGAARSLAFAPLVLAGIGFAFIVSSYVSRAARGPLTDWQWALLTVGALSYARACYWLVSIAAAVWCGRGEIEVRDDGAVRAFDRAGWFRPRWGRVKAGTLRRLILKEFSPVKDSTGKPAAPALFWHLLAETARGRKVWLALGYPREVLAALAAKLAQPVASELAQPVTDPVTGEPAAAPILVPVVVEAPDAPGRDVREQPPDSRVRLERHPDGVTVTVPRLGVVKGSGGMVFMGLIFSAVGGVFTVSLIERLLNPNAGPIGGTPIGAIFLVIGVVMLVASVQAGMKRVVLAVVGDRLLTFETGPLGSRRREFTRDGLRDIACGPSNVSVNKKPLPQLQIVEVYESTVGMLTGRDETELMWIATVLRQALKLPAAPPAA